MSSASGGVVESTLPREQPSSSLVASNGATITGDALPYYTHALLNEQFAYRGLLFGRAIGAQPPSDS